MTDNDIQAAATILGSMIVSDHPKVHGVNIVSVEWSVFAEMCVDLAEATPTRSVRGRPQGPKGARERMPHAEKRDGKLTAFWYGEVDLRHKCGEVFRRLKAFTRRARVRPSSALFSSFLKSGRAGRCL
jgi:hypothetical protein